MKSLAGVVTMLALAALAAPVWAQESDGAEDLPPFVRTQAAERLTHSAYELLLGAGAPARGQRMVLLAEMACRLDDGAWPARRLLVDTFRTVEDHEAAAEALEACLAAAPTDDALWRLWLASRLAAAQTAAQRQALLEETVTNEDIPPAVRAEAIVLFGQLLV
ncbi:MAG: hypothetical protein ACYTFO_08435, partial [Planctomycetota bacterium]